MTSSGKDSNWHRILLEKIVECEWLKSFWRNPESGHARVISYFFLTVKGRSPAHLACSVYPQNPDLLASLVPVIHINFLDGIDNSVPKSVQTASFKDNLGEAVFVCWPPAVVASRVYESFWSIIYTCGISGLYGMFKCREGPESAKSSSTKQLINSTLKDVLLKLVAFKTFATTR